MIYISKNLFTFINFSVSTLLRIFYKIFSLLTDPNIGRGREEERKGKRKREREGERRRGKEGRRRLEIAGVSPLNIPRE